MICRGGARKRSRPNVPWRVEVNGTAIVGSQWQVERRGDGRSSLQPSASALAVAAGDVRTVVNKSGSALTWYICFSSTAQGSCTRWANLKRGYSTWSRAACSRSSRLQRISCSPGRRRRAVNRDERRHARVRARTDTPPIATVSNIKKVRRRTPPGCARAHARVGVTTTTRAIRARDRTCQYVHHQLAVQDGSRVHLRCLRPRARDAQP